MNKIILNQKINAFLIINNNRQTILLFLYFTAISLAMILSGYTYLNDNDDWILWNFLITGETRTMIMSYPLSTVLSALYDSFPQVEWYSITVFFYLSLISLLFSFYISRLNDKYLKILSICIVTIILIHVWLQVSVTILTLLLIAVSIPLIRKHQIIFWVLVLIASFLRTGIIFSLSPLLVLVYFLLFEKEYFSAKRIFIILTLFSVILLNYISPSMNKEYQEWLQYNKARSYFVDFKGTDKKNILSEDEKFLSYTWYAGDTILLPSKKIMEAAGSAKDVAINKIFMTLQSFRSILSLAWQKERNHKLLIFLILLTFYLMYKERSNFSRMFYLLFILGFFSLTIVRDNDRAIFPIILLWGILIFLKLLKKQQIFLLKGFLLLTVPIFIMDLPVNRILNNAENEELKNELVQLVHKYPMKYEVASSFPRTLYDVGNVFVQSHIFDEKRWIHSARDNILFSAWISRHPYFYYSHNISFKGEKRKYDSFYEFVLDENTGFIGSKIIDSKVNNVILRMYDEKYTFSEDCYHTINVLSETEHFSVTQLIRNCGE